MKLLSPRQDFLPRSEGVENLVDEPWESYQILGYWDLLELECNFKMIVQDVIIIPIICKLNFLIFLIDWMKSAMSTINQKTLLKMMMLGWHPS